MKYRVTLTSDAIEDLQRLEDYLFDAAIRLGDFELPLRAIAALRHELKILETNPFTCRIADMDPLERELVIPFRASGYVALFRILGEQDVAVAAVRHQREDDYH